MNPRVRKLLNSAMRAARYSGSSRPGTDCKATAQGEAAGYMFRALELVEEEIRAADDRAQAIVQGHLSNLIMGEMARLTAETVEEIRQIDKSCRIDTMSREGLHAEFNRLSEIRPILSRYEQIRLQELAKAIGVDAVRMDDTDTDGDADPGDTPWNF